MPSAGYKGTHDIVMAIGGVDYGFMLVEEKGRKSWDVYDSPTVAPQFTSTEPGYGNYPPEREVVKLQSDFRAGFGRRFYSNSPDYFIPGSVDARWKNQVILGPNTTATTKAASAALSGTGVKFAEFKDTLYLGCTNILYKWSAASTQWESVKDFSADVITDLCPYNGLLYIALSGTVNYQVASSATVYASQNGSSKADYFAVLGNTLFKAASANIVKSSTTCHLDLTAPAPDVALSAGTGIDAGTHKYKIQFLSGTVFSSAGTVSAELNHQVPNRSTALTNIPLHPTDNNVTRRVLRNKVAAQSTWFTVEEIGNNTATTYTDDVADSALTALGAGSNPWSAEYKVGDEETDILSLLNYRSLLYAGKEDALYSINSAGSVSQVITDFRMARSTKNFNRMAVWRDKLFFNVGKAGVYAYDGTNIEALSWDILAPDVGIYGEVGAFAPSHDFMYVAIKPAGTGQNMTLCTLREENIDGVVDWRWHGIRKYAMDTPAAAIISPLAASTVNPNLWIAGTDVSAGNKPIYIYLPVIGGSPADDAVYTFTTAASAQIETCNYDMGFRADRKIFTAVDIISTHPGTGQTITVAYAVDGASSYTAIANSVTAGPVTTKYINAVGRYIRYRLTFATDDSAKTPRLHGIVTRAVLRAGRRKVYEFAVRVADEVQMRNGQVDKQVAATLAAALKDADDPTVQTGAVTLYDRDNTSHTVIFESMRELEVVDEVNRRPERHFYIRAVEVKLS